MQVFNLYFLYVSFLYDTVAPRLTTRPTDQTVVEADQAAFYCAATGNPRPKITWSKDAKTVGIGEKLSFEATRNHSGKYWCSADNGLQPSDNASAVLDVQCKCNLLIFPISCLQLMQCFLVVYRVMLRMILFFCRTRNIIRKHCVAATVFHGSTTQ